MVKNSTTYSCQLQILQIISKNLILKTMTNNPITLYSGGGSSEHQKSFVYEGGTTLYHFSPYDNGFSKTLETNIIFFANSEEHAKDVLRRMFEFVIDCLKQQSLYNHRCNPSMKIDELGFTLGNCREGIRFMLYLEELKKNNLKVSLAPTNQFYKVSWASNDNIF